MKPATYSIRAESSESTFQNIIRLLAANGGRLSLAEAARMAGLSASRFSNALKKAQGISFRDARRRARLEMAAGQLSDTGLRVTRISELSGYSELAKFEIAFRKHFGVSPRAYRKQNSSSGQHK